VQEGGWLSLAYTVKNYPQHPAIADSSEILQGWKLLRLASQQSGVQVVGVLQVREDASL